MKQYLLKNYYVTSRLGADYREALENLFFFNEQQSKIQSALNDSVVRYGTPQISESKGLLILELRSIPQVQTFFILQDGLRPDLAGVTVYTREDSLLRVIYVGLDPRHTHALPNSDYLLVELFEVLRDVGQRIRGVEFVEFDRGTKRLRLRVRRANWVKSK